MGIVRVGVHAAHRPMLAILRIRSTSMRYLQDHGTQSKLRMRREDRSKDEAVGDCCYTLVLRDAGFADADAFETTCRRAAGCFVRKHAPEHLRVFCHREFDPCGRRVHATRQMSSGR